MEPQVACHWDRKLSHVGRQNMTYPDCIHENHANPAEVSDPCWPLALKSGSSCARGEDLLIPSVKKHQKQCYDLYITLSQFISSFISSAGPSFAEKLLFWSAKPWPCHVDSTLRSHVWSLKMVIKTDGKVFDGVGYANDTPPRIECPQADWKLFSNHCLQDSRAWRVIMYFGDHA